MDYNTPLARQSLTHSDVFGAKLDQDVNFVLLSPTSYYYNCIAYAMGMQDRWVDSADLPWHWWPPVIKGETEQDLVEAFRYFGFEPCGMDDSIDEAYDKVALYHKEGRWTHAARIVADGVYHSKFGASYDGTHSRGDVLQAQYGEPYVIMQRAKEAAHLTDDRKGNRPGEIHTNLEVSIDGYTNHLVCHAGKTYLAGLGREVRVVDRTVEFV